MQMPKRPTAKKSISLNTRPAGVFMLDTLRRLAPKVVTQRWPRSHGDDRDALAERLRNAPSAGTPLTAEEAADLEEARAEFRNGDFVIDPLTARDREIAASRR
jgi:hypothetical protein